MRARAARPVAGPRRPDAEAPRAEATRGAPDRAAVQPNRMHRRRKTPVRVATAAVAHLDRAVARRRRRSLSSALSSPSRAAGGWRIPALGAAHAPLKTPL